MAIRGFRYVDRVVAEQHEFCHKEFRIEKLFETTCSKSLKIWKLLRNVFEEIQFFQIESSYSILIDHAIRRIW